MKSKKFKSYAQEPDETQAYDVLLRNDMPKFESYVLICMAFDRDFFTRISDLVNRDADGELVYDFLDPLDTALCEGIKIYHRSTGYIFSGQMNPEMMRMSLETLFASGKLITPGEITPTIGSFYSRVMMVDMTTARLCVEALTFKWLSGKRHKLMSTHTAVLNLSAEEFNEELGKELARIRDALKPGVQRTFTPSEALAVPMDNRIRFTTGITALDKAFGGAAKKEASLFMALSGRGKTVRAINLCAHSALNGRKSLLITTENSQQANDLMYRIISSTCDVPFNSLKDGMNIKTFSDYQRNTYEKNIPLLDANLRIHQWNMYGGSIHSGMPDLIKKIADIMGGLDVVALDWLGGALGDSTEDPHVLRNKYQNGADAFIRLASDMDFYGEFYAQLMPIAKNRAVVTSDMLQNCKTTGNNATNIFGLSALMEIQNDINNVTYKKNQLICISKARKGESKLIPVTTNFALQRFDDFIKN